MGMTEGRHLTSLQDLLERRSTDMTDKQLINSVENCVSDSLYGFSRLRPDLFVDFTRGVVFDPNSRRRVAVISGGGSGHEPFPAGFVGDGMLTASVSGPVFTSPPSRNIFQAISLASANSSAVLLLVPNYTGDILNFGFAAENAVEEGLTVESVVVGDDVAQEMRGICSKAGKRGMCGLILVMKISGYFSQNGDDLETVKSWASLVVQSTASMGLCMTACSKPGVGPLFRLEKDEMELGVGVHGEAGVGRVKMLSAKEAVKTLLDVILKSLKVVEGERVVVMVNDLGALSLLEQWLLAGEVEKQLSGKKIKVERLYAGRFFTSLNMAGVQICVLRLEADTGETILTALDHPTAASAWRRVTRLPGSNVHTAPIGPQITHSFKGPRLPQKQAKIFGKAVEKIAIGFEREKARLDELDSVCGDGDCGNTFSHIAALLRRYSRQWDFTQPHTLFSNLSSLLEESVGGTTGALYGLFLKGVSKELSKHNTLDMFICSKCWREGVEAIKKYSKARLGDRTMLDSLEYGCQAFERYLRENPYDAFRKAVRAAEEGCQKTKSMRALAGRASYTDQTHQKDVDAGAYAVTVWLSAIELALIESD